MEKNGIFNAASSFNKLWNTKYYENESRFKGIFSSDVPKKIKDVEYVINLDENIDVGTYWIVLFCNRSFDSFGVEHVPEEIKDLIKHII